MLPDMMGVRRIAVVGVLSAAVVLVGAVAWTQPPSSTARPPYRLGIGDVIEVLVVGEIDYSTVPPGIEVGPDGCVGIPSLGSVAVEGKTCDEAAATIAQAFRDRKILLRPEVLVRVSQYRYPRINVIGATRMPGSFAFHPGMDVRDAIALSGGLLMEEGTLAASRMRARVIHADGKSEAIKLDEVLAGAGPAPELQVGDTVVFELEASVSVLGYVVHPGSFKVQDNTRLSAVIAQAGGAASPGNTTETGDLRHVLVNRADGTKVEVDLKAVLAGQGGDDPPVSPGDVIYVPPSVQDAAVFGYVQIPGRFPFRDGDRVTDLLARANGALVGMPRGDVTHAVLARADGTVQTLDLSKPLAGQRTNENDPQIRPGDLLTIPEARSRVIVAGYVRTPGYYDFRTGDTVRTALSYAGDVIPNVGSPSAVRVRHADNTEVVLDLDKDNPALQPGDEVSVLYNRHTVTVTGYVMQPGQFEWQKGDTVVDDIARASNPLLSRETSGFLTEKGHPTQALLIRPTGGDYQITSLNLARFYKTGDKSQNPEVEPGDIILVPRKTLVDYERIVRDLLVIPSLSKTLGF